jgi:hypothetical protein
MYLSAPIERARKTDTQLARQIMALSGGFASDGAEAR